MSTKINKQIKTIQCNNTDAVIIYSENGNINLLVPEMQELEDDDIVDDHIVVMAAIAIKLNIDNSFKTELIGWYENYLNNNNLSIHNNDNVKWN